MEKQKQKQVILREADFIQHENRLWMDSKTLGRYLGFMHPIRSISTIYKRNKDELEPFTVVINLMTNPGSGNPNKRLFNEQGCYIVAMLAKTPAAKVFRRELAQFIKTIRIYSGSIEELKEEYLKLKKSVAELKFKTLLDRSKKLNKRKFERLLELKKVLNNYELAKLYDMSESSIRHYLSLYYETQGELSPQLEQSNE